MGPAGKSATTVTSPPAVGSFPAAAPPSLRRSLDLSPWVLPTPITVRRPTLRVAGTTTSRAAQPLPVKCSAAAARASVSVALPRILRVAAPNFRDSSQNTIRTPLEGARNGANPSFKFFAIGDVPLGGMFPGVVIGAFSKPADDGQVSCPVHHPVFSNLADRIKHSGG